MANNSRVRCIADIETGIDVVGDAVTDSLTVNGDLTVTGDVITLSDLPTEDPTVAGVLWNDSGTVKVSAGT